jgi:hypothetical protein
MDALAYILNKYDLVPWQRLPVEIPNTGRDDLAKLFAELGYTIGAEIGTERGIYAETLCKANPRAALICVDSWTAYSGYRDHTQQDEIDGCFREAVERLAKYNTVIKRMPSMTAAAAIQDKSLDFVYIDANHEWPYVTQDIYYWARKVRSGGIVAGHDYIRSVKRDSKNHVVGAVNGYTFAFRIYPWFLLGTKAKTPGLVRDQCRSWFWVVE